MRIITLIIIHCSATPEGKSLSAEACRQDHILHRGFRDIGYHFYITRDGEIHRGRALEKIGAHCRNHNAHSIGHHDLNPMKECPCFNCTEEYRELDGII